MAEESVRERIIQDILTSLEQINGLGAYHHSLVRIQRGKPGADDVTNLPAAFVEEGEEGIAQESNGLLTRLLPITIEVRIRLDDTAWSVSAEDDLETLINRMLADVERALGADPTRGGLAVRTTPTNNSVMKDETSGLLASIRSQFELQWWTVPGDPANAG